MKKNQNIFHEKTPGTMSPVPANNAAERNIKRPKSQIHCFNLYCTNTVLSD